MLSTPCSVEYSLELFEVPVWKCGNETNQAFCLIHLAFANHAYRETMLRDELKIDMLLDWTFEGCFLMAT